MPQPGDYQVWSDLIDPYNSPQEWAESILDGSLDWDDAVQDIKVYCREAAEGGMSDGVSAEDLAETMIALLEYELRGK